MTVVIIAAILLVSAGITYFIITKSKFETRVAEKDLIINSLKQHVSALEDSTAKSVAQTEEIKKLKSEIQSLNDKMKPGTKSTSGVSISGISVSGISTTAIDSDSKKKANKKK